MTFSVTILGSNSAMPTNQRHPSAQLINIRERLFLVDCGEGTQMRLMEYKIKFSRIHHIFISHLHGDHYFGLMGLLFTYHLLNRQEPLHLYVHKEMEEVINVQLKAAHARLIYPLVFHEINPTLSEVIYEDELLTVTTIPLVHRIPTHGFLFKEKTRERKIKKDVLERENIPYSCLKSIKDGADYTTKDGRLLSNSEITDDPECARSYAYCSDTRYDESILLYVKNTDLLYHEATFMQAEANKAFEKYHSTAADAATIAQKAGVKKLLLGHFSSRYDDLQQLLHEAQAIFPSTDLAVDGKTFLI